MNLLEEKVLKYCVENNIKISAKRVLVAVSGGSDSVALCHILHSLQVRFAIAHCNFGLRDKESEEDEAFVKSLAEKLRVPFFTKKMDTQNYALENKLSIQVAARNLRYTWFKELMVEHNFYYIATAHHASDQVETVLYNFIKGTGIKGLRGILPNQDRLIRPLLFAAKDWIMDYLNTHQISFREDSSNASEKYARNKIRHQLIPLIQELNPSFEKTILAQINLYKNMDFLEKESLQKWIKENATERNKEFIFPIKNLVKNNHGFFYLQSFLHQKGFSNSQILDVINCLENESGKSFYTKELHLFKDRKQLVLTSLKTADTNYFLVEKGTESILLGNQLCTFKVIENNSLQINTDSKYAYLDFDLIQFPLQIRHFETGDYFYPLGMKMKQKKVVKFFRDIKKPLTEKATAWILATGDRIVWVMGERIDERFAITPKTKTVLQIKLSSK